MINERKDITIQSIAEGVGQVFWLETIISPSSVEFQEMLLDAENLSASREFILRNELAVVCKDVRHDGATRKKLETLFNVFTVVAYPNMSPQEQKITGYTANPDQVIEIDEDTIEAIRWIWQTFNLQVPQDQQELCPLLSEG